MKKLYSFLIILCTFLLTACNGTSIGIIGGADGPTKIYVSEKNKKELPVFGEQYEKRPVRMINVDGELYFDSGLTSDNSPRCGTLDGTLAKTVRENEIPKKSGEANFEAAGYQNATTITKEVCTDGKWVIFRKYESYERSLKGLSYCHYIKGHLNNAANDSEIIVLSEKEDVTFNDVYAPLLSSQLNPGAVNGIISHNAINPDKWGLQLFAEDVTPTGLKLKFEQFGGNPSGTLQYGAQYTLDTTIDDEWQPVETTTGEPLVWNALAYSIKMNDITETSINWEYGYGKLKPGYYRLNKEIMDFRGTGDYDKEIYTVYFSIEE